MAQSDAEILRSTYDALGKDDLDAVRAALADNVVWHLPGDNLVDGDYSGPQEVRDLFASIKELTGGTLWIELGEISEDGDTLTALTTVSGERDGSQGEYVARSTWSFADGRISSCFEGYDDQAGVDAFWHG